MTWNFDMSQAPKGKTVLVERAGKNGPTEVPVFRSDKVIIATEDGTVTVSRWLPEELRWEMCSKKDTIIAWHPWPEFPGVPS